MILFDFNQVAISNLMVQLGNNRNKFNEQTLRHMVLNSIRAYRTKFSNEFEHGQFVVCCDDSKNWRKDIFPYYKMNRKLARDKSEFDWPLMFESFDRIQEEIKENFPYMLLRVPKAEADDIIGHLCNRFGMDTALFSGVDEHNKILIISGDKDFAQLQKYSNVWQFSPVLKKWIDIPNPERFLKAHIMKGDSDDGVPNILSKDSCLVKKIRQTPLTKKKFDAWIGQEPKDFCNEEMLRNWHRNNVMVNLDLIPEKITAQVDKLYDDYILPSRKGLLNYFIQKNLRNLREHIGDF